MELRRHAWVGASPSACHWQVFPLRAWRLLCQRRAAPATSPPTLRASRRRPPAVAQCLSITQFNLLHPVLSLPPTSRGTSWTSARHARSRSTPTCMTPARKWYNTQPRKM